MDISNQKIEFECPNCHSKVPITLGQAEKEEIVVCPGCKKNIQLRDKDGSVSQSRHDIEKGIKDLQEEIKKINKNLKFNIKM